MSDKSVRIHKKHLDDIKDEHGGSIWDTFKSIGNALAPIAKKVAPTLANLGVSALTDNPAMGNIAGTIVHAGLNGSGFISSAKNIAKRVASNKDVQNAVLDTAVKAITGTGMKKRGRPKKGGNLIGTLKNIGRVVGPAVGPTLANSLITNATGNSQYGNLAGSVTKSALGGSVLPLGGALPSYGLGGTRLQNSFANVQDRMEYIRSHKKGGSLPGFINVLAKDVAKPIGTLAGKPFEKTVGVNPFSIGYTIGHDYVSPAIDKLKGSGMKRKHKK